MQGYTDIHQIDEPSEKMWMGEEEERKVFRNAYVVKPGSFDFSELKLYCERIVYVTDGQADHVDNLREQIETAFQDLDASKDIIVPVGSAIVVFLTGQIFQRRSDWDSFIMGIFLNGAYRFWRIYTDPERESEEIVLRND